MNSDITMTDTQRAEDQTKVRKQNSRRIKPRMNRKELIKLANDEIREWQKFKKVLETKPEKEKK